ncbi:MAG: SPOR domain-containing protein [Alphaproteobacteria bacterium]|nr:SPOR domain-containing protein [Alphaproteobacteria bacterium]
MAEPQDVLAGALSDLRGREIERRRGARDLWVSRSHVAAAAAGACALALTTFGLGWFLGGSSAPPPARAALTSELPREELLQLLARIDGNSAGAGAAEAITFPDALRGGAAAGGAAVAPPNGEGTATHVAGDPAAVMGEPGALPTTGFTIVAGRFDALSDARQLRDRLRAAGLDAWIATELVDGTSRHRVAIGHHASEADAAEALPLLQGVGSVEVESLGVDE